jgi:ABC-type polysaccharide/polyol phosphate transport system ATPase subunit
MPAGAIACRGVSKRFTKYEDTPTLAYGLMHAWRRGRRSKLWAVRDVDLDIKAGEAVALMGRNGSGKSTLLTMLCGVTGPTNGEVRIGGRIAPLISVGVGFHTELTGRENVYVNGTILGLSRSEITRRLDEIVGFSEIESFIDTPVKFYSSGMYVRLGFSVAAHVNPDVLLVDEVLAVGDAAFQQKCFRHMQRLRESGTTIVLVSHNTAAMEAHCDRGVLLERGQKVFDGAVGEAISTYFTRLGEVEESMRSEYDPRLETGALEVIGAELRPADGEPRARFTAGEDVVLSVTVRARTEIRRPYLSFTVLSRDGTGVYHDHNLFDPFPSLAAGEERTLEGRFRLQLTTGNYTLQFSVGRGNPTESHESTLDNVALLIPPRRMPFYVRGRESPKGLADFHASFVVAERPINGRFNGDAEAAASSHQVGEEPVEATVDPHGEAE